ncbi:hypothetical protein [Streptomyces sp. AV19]|uniref:hypothetical protein n=1 Tax=Streptomyces sp. AV19 TaxID=2793068 RepID=UPI00241350D6|nr:hypothetical protein [Streptomyces sp. AV19]MDG4534686.1 hypothetical protein [Streptomyces sp. AV19]
MAGRRCRVTRTAHGRAAFTPRGGDPSEHQSAGPPRPSFAEQAVGGLRYLGDVLGPGPRFPAAAEEAVPVLLDGRCHRTSRGTDAPEDVRHTAPFECSPVLSGDRAGVRLFLRPPGRLDGRCEPGTRPGGPGGARTPGQRPAGPGPGTGRPLPASSPRAAFLRPDEAGGIGGAKAVVEAARAQLT